MIAFGLLLLLIFFKATCANEDAAKITDAPKTTPAPPVPPVPRFYVRNSSGICLLVQMNLKVTIRYFNDKGEEEKKAFHLNKTDQVYKNIGGCTPSYQWIGLYWNTADSNNTFSTTLNFTMGPNKDHFSLTSITFGYKLTEHDFPGTNDTAGYNVSHEVSKFTCPIGYYYRCTAKQTFELTGSVPKPPKPLVLYELSSMKVEAFRDSDKDDFVGKERMCLADYVPDRIIPIVVGVILACFILIAVLAFVIGVRRRRIGYQTL